MVKPVYFVLGAIPVIVAILLALPLVTKNEIPVSASNSFDKIEIEYTKHQLKQEWDGSRFLKKMEKYFKLNLEK